jgi:DNA-directed RNA polymerase subunit alpha
VRPEKCLAAAGILTIRQLVGKTRIELLGIRNFGRTSLKEVREKLKLRGLVLADEKRKDVN